MTYEFFKRVAQFYWHFVLLSAASDGHASSLCFDNYVTFEVFVNSGVK